MGVRSQLDVKGAYVPSIGLGSIAVSPLDIASSYATLAAEGVYAEPMAIRRVVLEDGTVDTRRRLGRAQAPPRDLRGHCGDRDAHPRAERPVRDGHARRLRPSGRRQDRDGGAERRRVVRRVHARARDGGLDGLHAGRDPARQRARDRRDRRELPGRDVAAVHGAGARRTWSPRHSPSRRCGRKWKPFTRGEYALDYDPTPAYTDTETVDTEPSTTVDTEPSTKRPPLPPGASR